MKKKYILIITVIIAFLSCIESYEKTIERSKKYYQKAEKYYQKGKEDKAILFLREAIKLDIYNEKAFLKKLLSNFLFFLLILKHLFNKK